MKRSELLLRMTFCVLMLIGVLALPFRIHADNVEDTASLRINSNEFEFNLRKHILIVNSYHQGYSWTDGITTGILDVFYRHGLNAEIHIENLDSKRIRNPKVWKTALTNNIESFPPDYLDLIIVSDDDALNTLFEMGHAYHSVPIVFCGISSDVAAIPQKCPVFTGVEEYLPFEENIRLGLKLFPGTEHIVVVTDNSQTGQTHRQEAEQTLEKLALDDMDVIWLDGTSGLSTADLADRLRTLPDNSIVIFSIWHIDGEGHYWDPGNYYPLFSKICNAPVFVNTDVGLKYGFLGGKMSLSGKQGELAGELAVQILFGELQDKTYYIKDINEYRFNWQELKRWGIRRKDLPAGSLILNRPLTIYNQYKTFFWVTLSLIIMLFLLIGIVLIYHYRYRRYETQRTLQAHETKRLANRYNILLEQSNSAILIFRIESGEVLDVNRKACELFEYSEEKFLKLNLNRYFHNYHELMSEIDILKASPHEMELLKHDSGVFYAQVILNYLEEEDEKLIYAIVNDISIRKQQEEEIKKSRARLDEVLLYSKNAFWEWNLRTGKLRKDANFWRALDVDPATLKRDPEEAEYYLDHVHPEDREAFVLAVERAESGEADIINMEIRMSVEGRDVWVEVRGVVSERDPAGAGVIISGFMMNIDKRKKDEEEIRKSKEKAEESDRLKSAFISNISHEIRTPLNGIVGFSNLLGRENISQEDRRKYLAFINENNDLLLKLINDILEISKIETDTISLNLETCNLQKLCEDIIAQEQIDLLPTVTMHLGEAPDINVQVDKTKLVQILKNLISNAKKFTREGTITLDYSLKRDMVTFQIRDTGIGIPESLQEKVFERFYQIDPFVKGTGLGLSICKTIIEKTGGEIEIRSKEGEGTEVRFTFKYKKSKIGINDIEPEALSLTGGPQGEGTRKKHTVLIAEDDESNFVLLQIVLSGKYKIIRASTVEELLDLAEKYPSDVVLIDLNIPGLGEDLMASLRERTEGVPLIGIAANAAPEELDHVRRLGFDNYFSKPINIKLLLSRLDTLLS